MDGELGANVWNVHFAGSANILVFQNYSNVMEEVYLHRSHKKTNLSCIEIFEGGMETN